MIKKYIQFEGKYVRGIIEKGIVKFLSPIIVYDNNGKKTTMDLDELGDFIDELDSINKELKLIYKEFKKNKKKNNT